MPSRRAVLAATALGFASAAGCLDRSGDGDEQVSDALGALPEPLGVEDPTVVGVSDSDLAAIRDATGPLTERRDRLGQAAASFDQEVGAVDLADLDRAAAVGAVDQDSGGTFLAAVIEGSYEVDAVTDLIEEESDAEPRSEGGFTWYDLSNVEESSAVVAVSERRLVFAGVESADVGTGELASQAIGATTSGGGPVSAIGGDLAGTYDDVAGHANALGVSADPDAVAGELDLPEALAGLTAVGFGTTPRTEGISLDALLRFRSPEDLDLDAFELYFERQFSAALDDPLIDAITIEAADDRTIRASADVEGQAYEDSEYASALSLPLYAFAGTYLLGFGGSAGGGGGGGSQAAVPQVAWGFTRREDERVEIVHEGGDAVRRPLRITYTSDGERVTERWDPEDRIGAGDSYTTERAADDGTDLAIVWVGEGDAVEVGSFRVR